MREMKMLPFGLLALIAGVAACTDPDEKPSTSDSGGSGSSSSSSSGDLNGITGTAKDTFWAKSGDELVFIKDRWTAIEAIADKSYPGTISATGDISIPDVPMGPYWLALTGAPSSNLPNAQAARTFVEMDARVVDIGRVFTGRSDVAPMTKQSSIVIDATFGTPFHVYAEDMNGQVIQPLTDELQFVSRGAGLWGLADTFAELTGPADGAMQVNGWTFDMRENFQNLLALGTPLVDASKGDDFVVTHGAATLVGNAMPDGDPWTGYQSISVVESASAANVTMTDGSMTKVTLGFMPVAQKNFGLVYKGSAFNALLPAGITDPVAVGLSVVMEVGTPRPGIGTFASLWGVSVGSEMAYTNPDPACQGAGCDPMVCATMCDPGTLVHPGDHTHLFDYGNPFQYGQELFTTVISFNKNVRNLLPEMTLERLRGFMTLTVPVADVIGKPIQPTLGLPQNIKVAGKAALLDQITTAVGTAPVITWDAPSIGTPTHYRVAVIDLKDMTGLDGTPSFRRTVATMYTKGTQVTVPDGIMQAGTNYYIQVTADMADAYDSSKPFVDAQRLASSRMFSGVVTP